MGSKKETMATRPTLHSGLSGSKGTAVGDAILTWRNYMGLPPAANETNYSFGPATITKTKAWQSANGLSADGVVGPASWAKYDALQGGGAAAYGPPTAAEAAAHQAVAAIAQAAQTPPSATAAAKAVSSQAAIPAAAHIAAAQVAGKTPPASVTSATPPVGIKAKVVAAEHGVLHEVEALYNKIPLWARIGLGTFSTLLTIVGLKKAFNKH